MTSLATQTVLVLDVYGRANEDEVVALLPASRRELRFHYLRDYVDTKALDGMQQGQPMPFANLAAGVSTLTRSARRAVESAADQTEWYVYGQAPLPLFALLGFELSAWAKPLTFLNRRKDGTWDSLPINSAADTAKMPQVFETVGLESTHEATGRVAVFVSVMGNAAPSGPIHGYFGARGETLAGLVQVRTPVPVLLTADNVATAAQELAEALSALATAYPNALTRGAALFVSGPASLAFLLGRSVNPNIVREVWVPNFVSGEYQDAVALPMPESTYRALDFSADAVTERAAILVAMRDALTDLQNEFKPDHLGDANLNLHPEQFADGLRQLRLPDEPADDAFTLRVLERELRIGDQILDALRSIDRDLVGQVTQHLIVHELVHNFQDLTHANFRNVGRAAVALEEIDFWADAYTVGALARMRAESTSYSVHDAITSEIDHVLLGIETFDRAQHGSEITLLYERRLRRYLIWHLQRARAATARTREDVSNLLNSRLIVELVPLAGNLDARYDKLVDCTLPQPELIVACGPRLKRLSSSANLDLSTLLDDVRHFRRGPILEIMRRVVTEAGDLLADWATLH